MKIVYLSKICVISKDRRKNFLSLTLTHTYVITVGKKRILMDIMGLDYPSRYRYDFIDRLM